MKRKLVTVNRLCLQDSKELGREFRQDEKQSRFNSSLIGEI